MGPFARGRHRHPPTRAWRHSHLGLWPARGLLWKCGCVPGMSYPATIGSWIQPRAQPDPTRWHVDVPTLNFTASLHRSTFGPWDPAHWQALTETKVPFLAGKWDGTREALMQNEGLAADGASMPARYF